MKPGSTSTSQKPRKRAGNGAIPPHQNLKNSTHNICGKGYADCLLGWTRGNFGALHAQGEHSDQCNVCRSPKESPASCHQVQTMWMSDYRSFVATWQCSVPYCLFNCCNNSRSVLWMSSISAVPTRPHPQWLTCLWTTQRSNGRQVFQALQRGAAGSAWVALSQKNYFLEVSMHFQTAGTLVWNAVATT